MTSNLLKTYLAFFLGAILAGGLSAEDTVRIEFQAVTWGAAMKDLFYRNEGKTIPLPVFPLREGVLTKFAYSGPPRIEFLRKAVSESGVTTYVTAGSVKIETAHKRFLVLFTPPVFGADPAGPLSAVALPNDTEYFSHGQLRLANCTPVPVVIKCNQQVVELPPGSSKIILPGTLQVRLEMAAWNGSQWQKIASTYLPLSAESRLNAFVYLGGRLSEENPVPPAPGEPISARDFSIITLTDATAS